MVHAIEEEAGTEKSGASQVTQPESDLPLSMPSCLPCCCTQALGGEEYQEREQYNAAKEQSHVPASWACTTTQKGTNKLNARVPL